MKLHVSIILGVRLLMFLHYSCVCTIFCHVEFPNIFKEFLIDGILFSFKFFALITNDSLMFLFISLSCSRSGSAVFMPRSTAGSASLWINDSDRYTKLVPVSTLQQQTLFDCRTALAVGIESRSLFRLFQGITMCWVITRCVDTFHKLGRSTFALIRF